MVKCDWGEAPRISKFYGREREITLLKKWILDDNCRLVVIRGMGGIGKTKLAVDLSRRGVGKTDLSVQVTKDLTSAFEYVIWRSLLNAPRMRELAADIEYFLTDHGNSLPPHETDGPVASLLQHLSGKACLVVLDNAEAILANHDDEVTFKPGFEDYWQLVAGITTLERSCILMNCREAPEDLEHLCAVDASARLLPLEGLDEASSKLLLSDYGHFTGDDAIRDLIAYYGGNPLALQLAARYITAVYAGDVPRFMNSGDGIFKDVRGLLAWHFERLTVGERELLMCLALNREPMSIGQLKEEVVSIKSKQQMGDTILAFQRKVPLEKVGTAFTMQPVLMEYATERLVTAVAYELKNCEPAYLESHALLKAQAKDYIREVQGRLILSSLVDQLQELLGPGQSLELRLIDALSRARDVSLRGYTAGNVVNLLCHTGLGCANRDLSALTIRQAFLQDAVLHNANFSGSKFIGCSFASSLGVVLTVAVDPSGRRLLTGDANGDLHLWNIFDGSEVRSYKGHASWVRSAVFSPDGTLIASGSSDWTVRIWNTEHGACVAVLTAHTDQVYSVAFNKDSTLLATGAEDQQVLLWNTAGWVMADKIRARGRVRCVAFSPDGNLLAIADERLNLWRLQSRELAEVALTIGRYMRRVTFSGDGSSLACLGEDGVISFVDVGSRTLVSSMQPHPKVRSIDFSSDGRYLAAGLENGRIQIWEWPTGKKHAEFDAHSLPIRTIAYRPGADLVISGSDDQSVKIWNANTRQCLRTIKGFANAVRGVAYNGRRREIVAGGQDGIVRLWRRDGSDPLPAMELRGHTETVQSVAFAPNGAVLASGSNDHTARLWDPVRGTCLHVLEGHTSWVWAIAFDLDGTTVATASRDYSVGLWEVNSGKLIRTLSGHEDEVHSVAFLNSTLLASGSDDNSIRIWRLDSGEPVGVLRGHNNCVRSVAYDCRNHRLASGSDDRTIKIWDIEQATTIKTLHGHSDRVRCVVFNPTGELLYSSSDDHSIKVWSVADGQCKMTYTGHEASIWSIAYDEHNDRLISGSEDGTVRLSASNEQPVILQPPRPYEGMNIYDVKGVTEAELNSLKRLGGVQHKPAVRRTAISRSAHGGDAPNLQNDDTSPALIMMGGGAKALAYIGALKELEKYYNFTWFVGTSSGAILAVLLAAGYTAADLEKIIYEKKFTDFFDANVIQMTFNLFAHGGLFPAHALTNWIEGLLSHKLESAVQVTLDMLPHRATVYACRRNKNALVFDSAIPRSSNIAAAHAIRCSMTIPFVFIPQLNEGMRVLDGGVRHNFPLEIFRRDNTGAEFVGLYLGPEHYEGQSGRHGLLGDLIAMWTEAASVETLAQFRDQVIVIDPRPITTLDFGLSNVEKDFLLKAGQVAALKFLKRRNVA
jgi:WD40 repeat protein/predicted acylesterase/phospholipase RssA